MNEKSLIKLIKSTLNSGYIGDDCAYLPDLGIVITQDSLVEDVHFKRDLITPFQLGYKTVMVNISDICASGAEPKYMTISLSLPDTVDEIFVKEFYEGVKEASQDVIIAGGDLTGSDKIYISASAVGSDGGRKISSRANAKSGYKIIVSGEHGNSAYGLRMLLKNNITPKGQINNKFINAHLMPAAQREFSRAISENIKDDYAMMDTSDGLADALMQIAQASEVKIDINSSKIPHDSAVDIDTVLYGGEDYQLVAAVPEYMLKNLNAYTIIGDVKTGDAGLVIDGEFYTDIDHKLYKHFKE